MEKQYYIGLDVHKLNTVYAVKDWNGQTVTTGKIATDYEDLKSVLERYLDNAKYLLKLQQVITNCIRTLNKTVIVLVLQIPLSYEG